MDMGINRNIVECKDRVQSDIHTVQDLCINRNIVECKDRWTQSFLCRAIMY